jgi:hypothetical protein
MELVSCEYEWAVGLKIYLHAAKSQSVSVTQQLLFNICDAP